MKKFLFTDHFLLIHLKLQTKTNSFFKLALIGSALCFSSTLFAQIRVLNIAFLDTGFCPSKIVNNKIQIETMIDFAGNGKFDCSDTGFDKKLPRFHGQLVLDEFLFHFKLVNSLTTIFPLVVFDKFGNQKKEYWLKAIEWIKKNKIDIVISASGLITKDLIVTSLPAFWFIPSGRLTPQIKKSDGLFPQILTSQSNIIMIGDYYEGSPPIYDQSLLYQDKIDYYFPAGNRDFVGTSRAVAEASAKALSVCPIETMKVCLKNRSKEILDPISKRKIQTF